MTVPKFRGWDREDHIMYDFMMMCFNVNLKNVLYRNKMTEFDVDMYTGLKDVNGKEIYEGDIVRYTRWTDKVGIVEYIQPEFELRNIGVNFDISPTLSMRHEMKVIGNVHENPELLEAE